MATATETEIRRPEPSPVAGRAEGQRRAREARLPAISGMAASVVTGLLVGVLTVGLTWGSHARLRGVRGTSSCGDPGFLLLVAILVAMVVARRAAAARWRVPDPGSTSFLGGRPDWPWSRCCSSSTCSFEWWMIIVIPVICAGSPSRSRTG